jgi:hypothetical protein
VITDLAELRPDKRNARRHSARNVEMVEAALDEVGAARSVLVDGEGRIIAGHATVEAAKRRGLKMRLVQADGHSLIAVRRRGLTEDQKTRMALYDNRAGELGEWNPEIVAAMHAETGQLQALFSTSELDDVLARVEGERVLPAEPTDAAYQENPAGGGGGGGAGGGTQELGAPQGLLALYLNALEYDELEAGVATLGERYDTEGTALTVIAALRRQYAALPAEARA